MLQAAESPIAAPTVELDAAILQAAVTAGLALLFAFLYRKTQKTFFAWFALAWTLYLVRIGAIAAFLRTEQWAWLYWHQVITGWTALALLGAALALRSPSARRRWYPALALFPVAWSYIAVYVMDSFLAAALPAVLFLSAITLLTAWIVWRHGRLTRAPGAELLAISLFLWGLHHLDYPFLRARGAWAPWGYYLDIIFSLLVGAGGLLLVLAERAADLERLQRRMIHQHEEERRRLSLHLHDETAQVFTAVRLRLGLLRERADPAAGPELDRTLSLLDDGIAGIRGVTQDLRPALLDDLGLVPALRALAEESADRFGFGLEANFATVPELSEDAELALYRALQEALTNVAEHAGARRVRVEVGTDGRDVRLSVRDDGGGFAAGIAVEDLERAGHLGLAGMRERLMAQGGRLTIGTSPDGGAVLTAIVPARRAASEP
jgi:signal transduction histidine kinase